MHNTLAGLVLIVAAGACGAQTSFTPTRAMAEPRPPRSEQEVVVHSASLPTRPYAEVGIVHAREEGGADLDLDELLSALRERAGQEGCDAIVLNGPDHEVRGYQTADYGSTWTTRGYWATCLVYLDGGAPGMQQRTTDSIAEPRISASSDSP